MNKLYFLKQKEKQYKNELKNNKIYSDEELVKEYKNFLQKGIVFENLFNNDRFFVSDSSSIKSFSSNLERLYCYTINMKEKIIDNFKIYFVSAVACLSAVASTIIAFFK